MSQKLVQPHPSALKVALDYVSTQAKSWNLTEQDVAEYFVQDSYVSDHNGVTHIFLIQQHKGIEVYNAIINVNVMPSGTVLYAGNRFIPNLANKINTITPQINAQKAVEAAFKHLNIEIKTPLRVSDKKADNEFVFDKGGNVLSDINVKLRFQKVDNNKVVLSWDLNIDQPDGNDHWSLRVDAVNGAIVNKNSWTTHCSFHPNAYHRLEDCPENNTPLSTTSIKSEISTENKTLAPVVVGDGTYNVFALPIESPSHGSRSLVVSPADSLASPYGWHDINGAVGGEYRITRGNNVHAYLDVNGDNVTDGGEPNGGTSYLFDFPYIAGGEPDTNKQAATVNLFYMNNMMHDIAFRYGFNEAAGNYQLKNYTGAAGANDYVKAEAQDAAKAASPSADNANFTSPADGSSGKMQMFVWNRPNEKLLHVTAPASLVDDLSVGSATFGPKITNTPITGQVVLVNDGSVNPTLGCTTLLNTNLSGKIAMVDRGDCFFNDKAYYAQKKGAIACLVCNFEESVVSMGKATSRADSITIPIVSLSKSNCDRLKKALNNGLTVSLYKPATSVGPDKLDGDFDNGIIAHEYTHGISSRLTGGRLNAGCLGSSELAAGEGWSDFLALAVTAKPGDKGTTTRGIGTYVLREPTNSIGIRNYAYSTDMSINPLTYDRIIYTSEVHDVGEVWTSALWDMYWKFVDVYGWDANIKNTQSGNGKAIRLVMDAMGLQPCEPGFLDARNAILAADSANFNGENKCLIWEAFSRRGMGFDALQGSPTETDDNTEGFATLPQCLKQLKIIKTATDYIKPGDAITYTIKVTNHKGTTATGVTVTDQIPSNTNYVAGSANRNVSVSAGVLTWSIGNLPTDSTIVMTYKVTSDPSKKSVAQFLDDMESGEAKWDVDQLVGSDVFWETTDIFSKSGKKSFAISYPSSGGTDQTLTTKNAIKVSGTQPVLQFFHKYDIQPAYDAGVVQISKDNGSTWENTTTSFFKTPYRGFVDYGTLKDNTAKGFWGKQDSFVSSYIDLKNYNNQNIKVRFRFVSDTSVSALGWFLDDVAVMDMYNYNSKATVTSTQKDTASAEVSFRGTIVAPTVFSATKDITNDLKVKVFPNPTDDILNVNIMGSEDSEVDVQILSIDGRVMYQNKSNLLGAQESVIPLSTSSYPAGMYIVKVSTGKNIIVQKVVKH